MDDANELQAGNPRRRDGTFLVYEFEGPYDDLPPMLEEIARWVRRCAEYSVEAISVHANMD